MRLARIAALLLSVLLSGCLLIPEREPNSAVYDAKTAAYPNCLADNNPRYSYRKRVAFTRLNVTNRTRLRGLYGIESRYMDALSQRLDRNRYQPLALSELNPDSTVAVDLHGKPMSKAQKIVNLARQHRAQFVVAGELIDMAQQQPRGYFSRMYRSKPVLGLYTSDPERMIVIRLEIYEGSSGLLIDHQTFKAWSKDAADLNPQYTLMGERFMNTALGVALDGLLAQQNNYVAGLLSCIPLQLEIKHMASLEQAVLSGGAAQGLRPGDKLKITRESRPSGVHSQTSGQTVVGKLVVEEVYPEHAIGSLQEDSGASLRQGDWARAW